MSCKLCSLFSSSYGTRILAYIPRFNYFLLLRDEQNSKCVCVWGGGVLAVIKCIFLPLTYLHFIQDIKDRCLLLMSSTSFVDLPFQEHRMMEKHHMDQNPCISSLLLALMKHRFHAPTC
jgi:hypothetical protein